MHAPRRPLRARPAGRYHIAFTASDNASLRIQGTALASTHPRMGTTGTLGNAVCARTQSTGGYAALPATATTTPGVNATVLPMVTLSISPL